MHPESYFDLSSGLPSRRRLDKYAGELQSQGVCDDAWIKGEKQKYEDASMASFDMAQPGQ